MRDLRWGRLSAIALGALVCAACSTPDLADEMEHDFGLTALPSDTFPVQEPIVTLGAITPETLAEMTRLGAIPTTGGDVPLDLSPDALEALERVHTDPGEIPQLQLLHDGQSYDLPLRHTHVDAEITGGIARVEVTQTYTNPFEEPIETIYVFPLPENSAVDAMQMTIGERVIEAEIQRRDQARETYEIAIEEGHTAALLEQERPNIFTQSVGNIAPNSTIEVTTAYVQDLTYDDGSYEFVFPMVVGPRFIPGNPIPDNHESGEGFSTDTDQVPDASRITPAVVGGGIRTGHDISLVIHGEAGFPVDTMISPTHRVATETAADGHFEVALAEANAIPNRDFVLRYEVAGAKTAASILSHREKGADAGYFSLTLQGPEMNVDELVGEREMIFVIDVSGSMSGDPIAQCKDAMRQLLRGLRPTDRFNVISFASREAMAFERSQEANQMNIKDALEFLDNLNAGGGTMMGTAIDAALTSNPESGRHRYVVFMTDARIGNEEAILGQTEALLNAYDGKDVKARVFSFGAGRSVNHSLIERLADVGDGLAVYSAEREHPTRAVNRLFSVIDHPILEDIEIDWGGLDVDAFAPVYMPDLFLSRPLVIHGRYGKPGAGTVIVSGRMGDEEIELVFEAELPETAADHEALETLWARATIDDHERTLFSGHHQGSIDAITELGLTHGLVTPYTSFVAVDRSVTHGDGDPLRVVQPGELDGLEHELQDGRIGGIANKDTGGGKKTKVQAEASPAPVVTPTAAATGDASAAGNTSGNYGLGLSGVGQGGGGSSSAIGYGGMGTAGRGGGSGTSAAGIGKLADKKIARPKLKAGRPNVMGSLDKSIIRKVVTQNKAGLRACYEASGAGDIHKLAVDWTISATGNVDSVVVNIPGEETLSRCLEGKIKKWKFPAAKGGGIVKVSYPLTFTGGGSGTSSGHSRELKVKGALSESVIEDALATNSNDLAGCRSKAELATNFAANGALVIEWTVSAKGNISKVTVDRLDDGGNEDYATCVIERIEGWKLPTSEGKTTVRYQLPLY